MVVSKNIIRFFQVLICFFVINTSNSQSIKNQEKFVVVIDAGHGGKDSGNTGNGYLEKRIALNISLQLGKILKKVECPYKLLSDCNQYHLEIDSLGLDV